MSPDTGETWGVIMQFQVRGIITAGYEALDSAISDLELVGNGATAHVYALSGPNGGLVSLRLSENGGTTVLDHQFFNPSWAPGIARDLALVDTGNGLRAVIGATGPTALGSYSLPANGSIGGFTAYSGFTAPEGRLPAMIETPEGLVVAQPDGGFSAYTVTGPNTLTHQSDMPDSPSALRGAITRFATLEVGTSDILIAASGSDHAITSYRLTPNGPVAADKSGPDQGVGLMVPTALATAEIGGAQYLIVASAQDTAGALSVFLVGATGSLTPTDHVLDTLDTRFGGVQSVAAMSAGGITYLVAGGADDGLSLFALLPGGQLQYLTSIEDRHDTSLQNVTAIAGTVLGDTLRLLVASQSESGLTDLAIDIADQGITYAATEGGQTFSGSAGDDFLIGNSGDDQISGGNGDDVIVDGAGRDLMTGGGGRDLFVLRNDGTEDIITDFNPALDRLDLSAWPMFHDPASLTINPTETGAEVIWRGEVLVLRGPGQTTLNPAAVRAAVLAGVNRPLDLSDYEFPADTAYDITGTDGDDTLFGGPGDQTIAPGPGNDTVWAGDGNDSVFGGAGVKLVHLEDGDDLFRDLSESQGSDGDVIIAGAGCDVIFTGSGEDLIDGGDDCDFIRSGAGNDLVLAGGGDDIVYGGSGWDRIEGGPGNDKLYGGAHRDRLFGDGGDDFLNGGDGDDMLFGRDGDDTLIGEDGDDVLRGDAGADTLRGGNGNDTLSGGDGDDLLFGGDGEDTIHGADGNDKLYGGYGMDLMNGGAGDDYLDGGTARDRIRGNEGNDIIIGGHGHDRLSGGDGNDFIRGGSQNDFLWGGTGNDDLAGDSGDDRLIGQLGNDLLDGGSGNDRLFGGPGADRLIGGAGDDLLSGGIAADTFVFDTDTSGYDRITDFNPDVDLIVIRQATASDLTLSSAAGDLRISWDNGEITLNGIASGEFSLSDILFD